MVRKLFELAKSQSDIKYQLQFMTPKVVEHLIYLTIDPKNINRNHWIEEIYAFIHDIDICKINKKFPKKSFIYSNTYGSSQDKYTNIPSMKKRLKGICDSENITFTDSIYDIVNKIDFVCSNYFDWLSYELSTYGVVTLEDVGKRLNKLLPR